MGGNQTVKTGRSPPHRVNHPEYSTGEEETHGQYGKKILREQEAGLKSLMMTIVRRNYCWRMMGQMGEISTEHESLKSKVHQGL